MPSLSSKSAQEISDLLDEYGIKHGPVVDSTRALYEKKVIEAMSKKKTPKQSPDKTFYREEEEEVTYVTYRTPVRNEGYEDGKPFIRSRPEYKERGFEDEKPYYSSRSDYSGEDSANQLYDLPSTYRNMAYSKATPVNSGGHVPEEAKKSSRLIPFWVQFLVFLVVAAFLYFVFCNMESAHSDPFKGID